MEDHIKRYQQGDLSNAELQVGLLSQEHKEDQAYETNVYTYNAVTNKQSMFTNTNIALTIGTISIYVFIIYIIVSYR